VTQVFDVEDDPEYGIVIVFELLEGESLLERLRRTGPMTPTTLHPVVSQILHGLAAAHAVGVIHRDLKPSNVFLERRPDGTSRVKILDFGISKLPKGMTKNTLTEPGQSLGSFMFMPPEQIHGAGRVDARADLYAVGTLAFQALTGHLPFDSTNIVELVRLKSSTNPRSLAQVLGRPVQPELEAWLARALSRDVNTRFQSAQEAALAWAQLAPHPSTAPPPMPAAEATNIPRSDPTSAAPRSRPPPLPQHASSPSIQAHALPPAAAWGAPNAGSASATPTPYPGAGYGPAPAPQGPPPLNQAGTPPLSPAAPPDPFGANAGAPPFFPNQAAPPGFPANASPTPFNPGAGAAPFNPGAGPAPFFNHAAQPPFGGASPAPFPPPAPGANAVPPPLPSGFAGSPPQAPGPGYAPYALAPGLSPPTAPPPGWSQPSPYGTPYGAPPLARRPSGGSPPVWAYGLVAVLIVVAVLVLMAVVYVRFG
ncbi:MAG TPA: protein kinase, partial [Polyangiaceae bacterium]|nr:protein kinase [Polyangiaceae bacterium]